MDGTEQREDTGSSGRNRTERRYSEFRTKERRYREFRTKES